MTGAGRSERMRVAIVLPFPAFGAAEDYAIVVADGLAERGHEVTIAHHAGCALPPQGSPTTAVAQKTVPRGTSESIPRLRRLFRELDPDIVHVNQIHLPSIAAGLRTHRDRLVVTSHNPALRPRRSARGALLARLVLPRVPAWIVLSHRNAALQAVQHVRDPHRIHVIAPGLPPDRTSNAYPREEARELLGMPSDAFVLGTVGRLARQKRHDLLIEAGRRLLDRIPDLRVVVVGDGELRSETRALAERSLPGRVLFTGWRGDAVRLLPAFDVFCLTSDFEGLSCALLEAMATGLPIVATDVQGSGEALTDGVGGLLVPAGSTVAIADAVAHLHDEPERAAAMGARARRTFLERYTADPMVERTLELYRRLEGR